MEMKTCIRCKESKEATLEYFAADKRISCGLAGWCRTCTNKYYRENYKSRKIGLADDGTRTKGFIAQKEVPTIPIPKVNMFKGHNYSIQTNRKNKEEVGRLVRGKVIQETDSFIAIQAKNYIESFSRWELSKYKIMEV